MCLFETIPNNFFRFFIFAMVNLGALVRLMAIVIVLYNE